jgi:hypothetical protein
VAAPAESPLVEVLEEVRPLARQLAVVLVRQELAGLTSSLNGAAPAPVTTTAAHDTNGATEAPSTRTCKTCGRELPLDRFAPNRHECKSCRNRKYPRHDRARGTVAADDKEALRTAADESGAET